MTTYICSPNGVANLPGTVDAPTSLLRAVPALGPGDYLRLLPGVYVPPAGENSRLIRRIASNPLRGTIDRPIVIIGDTGRDVIFDGGNDVGAYTAIELINPAHVTISNIVFRNWRGRVVSVSGRDSGVITEKIALVGLTVGQKHSRNTQYQYALVFEGPVRDSSILGCLVNGYSAGIQLTEYPQRNSADAWSPPRTGNTINEERLTRDYTESDIPDTWSGWRGIAPSGCLIDTCAVVDCTSPVPAHSDGFNLRYVSDCLVNHCIAINNGDDGFDIVGGYSNTIDRCIALNHRGGGDGNGFKMGVRGGFRNAIRGCISAFNRRMGIDLAYCMRADARLNTCFFNSGSPISFGISTECTGAHVIDNNALLGNGSGGVHANPDSSVSGNNYVLGMSDYTDDLIFSSQSLSDALTAFASDYQIGALHSAIIQLFSPRAGSPLDQARMGAVQLERNRRVVLTEDQITSVDSALRELTRVWNAVTGR